MDYIAKEQNVQGNNLPKKTCFLFFLFHMNCQGREKKPVN